MNKDQQPLVVAGTFVIMWSKKTKIGLVTLVLMCCCQGTTIAQQSKQQQTTTQQNNEGMDHSHIPIQVPNFAKPIYLSLKLSKDVMSGYNLTLLTENYNFTIPPEDADMRSLMTASVDNSTGNVEGHAHLYVNGNKIQRVYGQYLHLPEELFAEGVNSISITLNNHGHMYWTNEDKQVIATLFINESAPQLILHRFESFPVQQENY